MSEPLTFDTRLVQAGLEVDPRTARIPVALGSSTYAIEAHETADGCLLRCDVDSPGTSLAKYTDALNQLGDGEPGATEVVLAPNRLTVVRRLRSPTADGLRAAAVRLAGMTQVAEEIIAMLRTADAAEAFLKEPRGGFPDLQPALDMLETLPTTAAIEARRVAPTVIMVKRERALNAALAHLTVVIDGQPQKKLWRGQEGQFVVGAGDHTVKIKGPLLIKGSRTSTVHLQEGMTAGFSCRPNLAGGITLKAMPGTVEIDRAHVGKSWKRLVMFVALLIAVIVGGVLAYPLLFPTPQQRVSSEYSAMMSLDNRYIDDANSRDVATSTVGFLAQISNHETFDQYVSTVGVPTKYGADEQNVLAQDKALESILQQLQDSRAGATTPANVAAFNVLLAKEAAQRKVFEAAVAKLVSDH